MSINSLSSLFHQSLLPHVEVVEQEIIHQWDVNDFVVYLIKKQDALGKDILEYKTIQNQIEIYTEHIEIPASKSLERMISQLKACKIMLDENGMATFSRSYHTWENTPNLNAECEYHGHRS